MAIDAYMQFRKAADKTWLAAESQVQLKDNSPLATDTLGQAFGTGVSNGNMFEIQNYSFGVQNTLSIGSQSTGTGAGKVEFSPFTFHRKIDKSSPMLFQMACNGTSFDVVNLFLFKTAGATGSGTGGSCFLRYDFSLVGVSSVSWASDNETPYESVTLEYGALQVRYSPQKSDGTMQAAIPGMWSRVTNNNIFPTV